MLELNTIICGDCFNIMREMPDDCVDAIITDPPYGIHFLGKDWDKAGPSVDIWKECLRVLKPGAFAFVMCIPRQNCLARMIINLEDAGFNVGFSSILHCFASGFPKASNLSKSADRKLKAERKVVGQYVAPDGKKRGMDKGIRGGNFGAGEGDYISDKFITASTTPQAKRLDGWYAGCQLKPAYEVILVVQKPLKHGTNIDHALEWCQQQEEIENGERLVTGIAIGGINVDGCRIPYESEGDKETHNKSIERYKQSEYYKGSWANNSSIKNANSQLPKGRFPANLLCGSGIDINIDLLIEAKNKL